MYCKEILDLVGNATWTCQHAFILGLVFLISSINDPKRDGTQKLVEIHNMLTLYFCVSNSWKKIYIFFSIIIHPSPGLLPTLGPLERYMTHTLDAALLSSSRAGADLGRTLDFNSQRLRHVSQTLKRGPGVLHWELQHSLSATEQSIHHT